MMHMNHHQISCMLIIYIHDQQFSRYTLMSYTKRHQLICMLTR